MAHQGYDLQLTRYDERGWRATFYTTGIEHSPTSATGTLGSERRGTRRSGRASSLERQKVIISSSRAAEEDLMSRLSIVIAGC